MGIVPVRPTATTGKGKLKVVAGKLTARGVESLAKRKGRFFGRRRAAPSRLDPGKQVYWVYRLRLNGLDRETTVGGYPGESLAEARIKHADLRATLLEGIDPVGHQGAAKEKSKTVDDASIFGKVPTLPQQQEKRGGTREEPETPAAVRRRSPSLPNLVPLALPADEIGPREVFEALDPIWADKPETASPLRSRSDWCWITPAGQNTRPNPAAWADSLKTKLGSAKKLGKIDRKTGERVKRGDPPRCPTRLCPASVAPLREVDSIT